MQGFADSPVVKVVALVVGGTPGRLLAAYCESGNLDVNMKKACGDLATYYGLSAAILTAAGIFFAPLLILAPPVGAMAAIFAALAQGKPPDAGTVAAVAKGAAPVAKTFGSNVDTSKVADAAGAFQAAADANIVPGAKLPKLSEAPPSCHPISQAERAAKRATAVAAAKAKSAYKTKKAIAVACAKVKSYTKTTGKPYPHDTVDVFGMQFKVDPKCSVAPSTTSTTPTVTTGIEPAPKKGGSSKAALILALAAAGAKVAGVFG